MQFISHKIFSTEIGRVKQLSLITPYSFSLTRGAIIRLIKEQRATHDQEITLDEISGEKLKVYSVLHRLKGQAPRYLRELLFIRAISALEIFLIDTIKEIGKISPERFHSNEEITLNRGQLFSYKSLSELLQSLIEKDCRSLSSGGFKEVEKYYRTKLLLDFKALNPGFSVLDEYHDRRHLLVHKLGQVDSTYAHKYNSLAKNLTVPESYLRGALDNLEVFASDLNALVFRNFFGVSPPVNVGALRRLYVLEIYVPMPVYLKPDYEITTKTGKSTLSSLILNQTVVGKKMTIAVEGDEDSLDGFLERIRMGHVAGEIGVLYANPKKHQKGFEF